MSFELLLGTIGTIRTKQMRDKFLKVFHPYIDEDDIQAMADVMRSGWLTVGPKTLEFEREFAAYIGCEHAVAVNSCTAALHLSFMASGIGPGDEVITSPLTFTSTAASVIHSGARPVFVDIDPDTMNIDPGRVGEFIRDRCINSKDKPIDKITKDRVAAIVPVHYAGQPCDMDEIMGLAKRHNLKVIEDAAHAVKAIYKGRNIGTIGDLTCFSLYACKNLCAIEGGIVTTDDEEMAERIKVISLHGIDKDAWMRYSSEGNWYYEVMSPGYKYNFTDVQAALALTQLKKLSHMQKTREHIVSLYNNGLKGLDEIETPYIRKDVSMGWHLYVIRLRLDNLKISRDKFIEELKSRNIGAGVHFIPLYMHPYYREKYGYVEDDYPVSNDIYQRIISLPLFPGMKDKDANDVIEAVKEIVQNNKKSKLL